MGVIQHDLIVVTVWDKDDITSLEQFLAQVPEKYRDLFHFFSERFGQRTFVSAPDGSKEGWETSNDMDDLREELVYIIRGLKYPEGLIASYGELDNDTVWIRKDR